MCYTEFMNKRNTSPKPYASVRRIAVFLGGVSGVVGVLGGALGFTLVLVRGEVGPTLLVASLALGFTLWMARWVLWLLADIAESLHVIATGQRREPARQK